MKYNHKKIEKKWQKYWENNLELSQASDSSDKAKFYCLDMFPYPSGAGLHVGHVENYTATDIYSRFKRMQGFNVLHPIGWDAFGLPAENFAIKNGTHPDVSTHKNIKNFIGQIKSLGISYDWSREIDTSSPEYYKWTQWFFLFLYKNKLAYKKKAKVNWCQSCQTVVANEQVVDGKCERCGGEIIQKDLEQWFFKITDFIEDTENENGKISGLINGLDKIDWPNSTKINQKNWIGKSEGTVVKFQISNSKLQINFKSKISKIVVVHGCTDDEGDDTIMDHWHPWLENELKNRDIIVDRPALPCPWNPSYEEWKKTFEKIGIDEKSIVVAHSCGAAFSVRWLGENNKKIAKLILVAPWIVGSKDYSDGENDLYKFDINKDINNRIGEIIIFTSDNERKAGKESVEIYEKNLKARIIEIKNHGHFIESHMETNEFPELLSEILDDNYNLQTASSATSVEVFTTRVDTIFGCTYVVLAPESEILKQVQDDIRNYEEIEKYITDTKKKTDLERMENKEKTGVEIKGIKAVNPFNNEEVPIYVADYVIGSYGTGAVMAVPAHDERDFEFANRRNASLTNTDLTQTNAEKIEIRKSIEPVFKIKLSYENALLDQAVINEAQKNLNIEINGNDIIVTGSNNNDIDNIDKFKNELHINKMDIISGGDIFSDIESQYYDNNPFIGDGALIDSKEFTGLNSEEAREKMTDWLEENKLGERKVNYRLRDWLVSRQRYWGAPIPIIYCDDCGETAVPEKDLPVTLPTDVDFNPTGESPLVNSKTFHKVKCPNCGKNARRESDTMDTFVCSSWYYLRFADSKNEKEFAAKEKLEKWLPVDLYMGGAEHTVLHLLYARFFTKALAKFGYVKFDEPFLKLRHQGMIMAEDGRKMSKSLGNVVNPDDVVEMFGADALRIYEMFMGPIEEMKAWSMQNVNGPKNFLDKVWKLFNEKELISCEGTCKDIPKELPILLHKTIKKVTHDIENFNFNTAVSQMMIFTNGASNYDKLPKEAMEKFLILLAPFAPHMAEEIWSEILGHDKSIFLDGWPEFSEALTKDEEIELIVQVNGKVRDKIKVSAGISEEEAKEISLASEKIKRYTEGNEIKKIIFVKGKLVSIVI